MSPGPNELDVALLQWLKPKERDYLTSLLARIKPVWQPLPGPQTDAYLSPADVVGYGGAAGGGKGLALGTPIPTPTGWTTMGALRVGSEVIAPDGAATLVTAVTAPVLRPCYRLTFDDGAEFVADDVHRWLTFDAAELGALTRRTPEYRSMRRGKRLKRGKGVRHDLAAINTVRAACAVLDPPPSGTVRDTATIAATVTTRGGRHNHAIPVAEPLEGIHIGLPIPPYTLGAWLGDGTSSNGQMTTADPEVIRAIERDGFEVRRYHAIAYNVLGLRARLRTLGILGNKRVPPAYLRAPAADRLALLRGLMDTDGTCSFSGKCEFDSTRVELAEAVFELALSLGCKPTLREGRAQLRGKDCGPRWRVTFTTTLRVFNLERKACRQPSETRRTTRFRYIVACEPVPSVPTRCIAVAHPSRQYLAGRHMVPTHNTDLAIGLALTKHQKIGIFRQTGTELTAIIDRIGEVLGTRDGFNGAERIWRTKRPDGTPVQIELGSFPNIGDEMKYRGRPHDLLVFDEASDMRESAMRFVTGWLRTTDQHQRCRILMCFNPPGHAAGRWVVDYFAPWIDKDHPNPAAPGELRWFITVENKDREVPGPQPVEVDGKKLKPQSRTFIPSRVKDNPHLAGTGYEAHLHTLEEPFRSQMLEGDFSAGMKDDPYQVIKTRWVEAAQNRWKKLDVLPPMDSIGVDVALGGDDNTVIARRHGMWFDEPIVYTGKQSADGSTIAGYVVAALRNNAPIHLDLFGVGAQPFGHLMRSGVQVIGVNVGDPAGGVSRSGSIRFKNLRTELWWRMREALDPESNTGIALPPDRRLMADLCAPKWKLISGVIHVQSREDVVKEIGRSPDFASAYCLSLMDTMKRSVARALLRGPAAEWDPYRDL